MGSRWPPHIEALRRQHFMLSASSYKLAARCVRRWAAKEIYQLREPPTPATNFGSEAHAQIEKFLQSGADPDPMTPEGRLAIESIPHLPRPGEAEVEVPFAFALDGAWFYGRIDGIQASKCLKFDHKFVGSLDYAETPESLVRDPAAVLYTLAEPRFEITRLRWIYNLKRRKKGQAVSNPVDATLPIEQATAYARQHLVPAWRLLDGIRSALSEHREDPDFLAAIPCNPRDCLSYGRACPHLPHCTRDTPGLLEELIV